MDVTVIICTFNRCTLLKEALAAVAASVIDPSVEWEVLIVDNNSTDRTRSVVEEMSRLHPNRFRYLFEPRAGKSHALNSGIREARSEVLVFTDDDVTCEPDWLRNLTAALLNHECAGTGGRTLPDWQCVAPPWLHLSHPAALVPFAVFDLGPQSAPIDQPPFGANMAFRKKMFEKYGDFRTDLGPGVDGLFGNEDTEFGRRLLGAGERLYYEASAVVYHPVAPNRVRKGYLQRWWFGKGRADARHPGVEPGITCAGIPLYLLRRLLSSFLRWNLAFNSGNRFRYKLYTWYVAGSVFECYGFWSNQKSRLSHMWFRKGRHSAAPGCLSSREPARHIKNRIVP